MYFENALWEQKSNGNKYIILSIISACVLFFLLGTFLVWYLFMSTIGAIILFSCAIVVPLILAIVFINQLRWNNNTLVFAFTDKQFMYTSTKYNSNSHFLTDISEISGYSIVSQNDDLSTINIYFSKPQNAGSYGKLKFITMVKIANFNNLKEILTSKNIPLIKNEK